MQKETSRIASTPLRGLFPLGGPGDRSHGQLVDALAKRLGPRHAALLAEPEPVADGSAIDWYVPGHAKGTRLTDLDPESAEHLEDELARLSQEIRRYANELVETGRTTAERSLGLALQNALQVPGPDYVYAVGERPVLVAWAHRLDKESALPVGLVRRGAGRAVQKTAPSSSGETRVDVAEPEVAPVVGPPPADTMPPVADHPTLQRQTFRSTPAPVAVVTAFPWHLLLWLLFALFVAAILWSLLRACALNIGNIWHPGLSWCGSSTMLGADVRQIADLQAVIANLEEQLARTVDCPTPTPPTAPRGRIDQAEIQKRVEAAAGRSGELQVSLGWNGPADLDLHVQCADGQTISFRNRSTCGGTLDVDMNAERHSDTPVENVRFPSLERVPQGKMRIAVGWYGQRGESRDVVSATVVVRRTGNPPEEIRVDVRRPAAFPGAPVVVHEITVSQ